METGTSGENKVSKDASSFMWLLGFTGTGRGAGACGHNPNITVSSHCWNINMSFNIYLSLNSTRAE
jgi:hypothetical protein